MTYEIEVRRLPVQQTLTMRARTKPDAIGETLGKIFPEVMRYLDAQGLTPAGAPFARYHAFGEQNVELEAGMAVAQPVTGEGEIQPSELPGGEAAFTVHVGPYEGLERAHKALHSWIEQNDRKPAGGPWEIYVTDPMHEPAEKWRTEVYQPLE